MESNGGRQYIDATIESLAFRSHDSITALGTSRCSIFIQLPNLPQSAFFLMPNTVCAYVKLSKGKFSGIVGWIMPNVHSD